MKRAFFCFVKGGSVVVVLVMARTSSLLKVFMFMYVCVYVSCLQVKELQRIRQLLFRITEQVGRTCYSQYPQHDDVLLVTLLLNLHSTQGNALGGHLV